VSGPTPVKCPNGHENPSGNQFCGTCGARIVPSAADLQGRNGTPGEAQGSASSAPDLQASPRQKTHPPWLMPVGILVIAAIALGWYLLSHHSGAPGSATPANYTMSITAKGPCEGGGLDPPGPFYGTNSVDVQVLDPSGKVIGAATMSVTPVGIGVCAGDVQVSHLPSESFYQVNVGGSLGQATASLAQLKAQGWQVNVSVG
jgi:hypothetical protein